MWPLAVDGLLLLATVGLLKPGHQTRRMRVAVWSAFLGCIAVSLAANMAAAPRLAWQPILVAGWPPVALLLAVELLAHRSRSRHHTETEPAASVTGPASPVAQREPEKPAETVHVITLAGVSPTTDRSSGEPTAQEIMWAHYLKEQERGRTPTGAELDQWCLRHLEQNSGTRHNACHDGIEDRMVSANLPEHTPVTEISSLARTAAYLTQRGTEATQTERDTYEARKKALMTKLGQRLPSIPS